MSNILPFIIGGMVGSVVRQLCKKIKALIIEYREIVEDE